MLKRIIIFVLLVPSIAMAQAPWSGILAPARATDWSTAGVVGGIPSSAWAQCGSMIAAYGTSGAPASPATINNAILACAANHYVLLGPGNFFLNGGLVMKGNVVVRGSGPNSSSLIFSGGNACGGEGGQVCFIDSNGFFYGSTAVEPGGTNSAAWSSGYAQGATSITLSSVGSAGIVNGQYVYLDQNNDTSITATNLMVCDTKTPACSLEGGSPGRCSVGAGGSPCVSGGHIDRNEIQIVKVLSGCSSACTGAGPFTITITPGLDAANWASGKSPGVWWSANNMQNAGLENITIDSTAVGTSTESAIYFNNAFNCWVSNVRSIKPNRNHVWFWQSAHNTIQNSYFFGTQNTASQSYGLELFISSDNLGVNIIFQQVTAPIIMGPSQGSVFAYNFAINDPYTVPTTWMQQAFAWRHDAGALYNLSEGNITSGYWEDVFHGTGGLNTAFRNYGVGWETTKTQETTPVQAYSYNRFENWIGNVWGCNNTSASYPGPCGAPYHLNYQTSTGVGVAKSIYDFGAGNTESPITVAPDTYVAASSFRWGNYDVVNAAVQWNNAEVPTGLSDGYAQSVPASHTLPSSFFLSSKPSYFGSVPYPPIGPDVVGGNLPNLGGHVNLNPAANCYLTTMGGPADGSGSFLPFDASTCYSVVPPPVVAPPTNLGIFLVGP